jgi:hypothetical protein
MSRSMITWTVFSLLTSVGLGVLLLTIVDPIYALVSASVVANVIGYVEGDAHK